MSQKRKVLEGSASNIIRVLLSMLVSLVLPPFLVHRLPPPAYSAWVLILQLSAYVNLLDFGLQTAIGKFVAEHDAAGDREASHNVVSTSFTILSIAALIAVVGIAIMAGHIPQLFHQMPPSLVPEVRLGLLVVGCSAAMALPFSAFSAIFTGLQRYAFPTIVAIGVRVLSAASLITVLLLHGGLVQMAWVSAAFNIASAAAQFLGWRRLLRRHVDVSFFLFHREAARRLARYGSVLSLWTVAMLLISGLDTVIVGHYDYRNTGFYAIASSATNVMLVLVSSMFGPMLPALSSMQAKATPARLGEIATRATRYCAVLLCLLGLPLLVGAYPLLSLWVGRSYAASSARYLQVLVIGNIVRQLAYPYVIGVIATGKQHLATVSAIAEALVNVLLSIWLVQKFGAIGVAIGTLAGSFVSISVHVLVSMRSTRSTILLLRRQWVLYGLVRPLACVLPSCLLFFFWKSLTMVPAPPVLLALCAVATLAVAWWIALTTDDRLEVNRIVRRMAHLPAQRA